MKFEYEQYVDLSEIKDCLELKSDQTIARLETDDALVYLDVRGQVAVDYKGETYYSYDEFPKELKDLMHNDPFWWRNNDLCINSSNWFEVFYEGKNGDYWSDDCEACELLKPNQVFSVLFDYYTERKGRKMQNKIFRTTQSDLLQYNGTVVLVGNELTDAERDPECGRMWHIRCFDGNEIDAFEDELFEVM